MRKFEKISAFKAEEENLLSVANLKSITGGKAQNRTERYPTGDKQCPDTEVWVYNGQIPVSGRTEFPDGTYIQSYP